MRLAYTAMLRLALPFLLLRLWWRGRREPGYRRHIGERLGRYALPRKEKLVWVHAVSVGEGRAAAPLVHRLQQALPDHNPTVSRTHRYDRPRPVRHRAAGCPRLVCRPRGPGGDEGDRRHASGREKRSLNARPARIHGVKVPLIRRPARTFRTTQRIAQRFEPGPAAQLGWPPESRPM